MSRSKAEVDAHLRQYALDNLRATLTRMRADDAALEMRGPDLRMTRLK